jgi:hypothetical protein
MFHHYVDNFLKLSNNIQLKHIKISNKIRSQSCSTRLYGGLTVCIIRIWFGY